MASGKTKSKKPSTTKKFSPKQLEDCIFFVDRSAGKYTVPNELKKAGLNVERHDDHFPQNAFDPKWILYCGEKGWIIVSGDKNIKRNELERRAIFAAKVAAFFFTSNSISGEEQAKAFITALPKIAKFLTNHQKPFIARISPNGDVKLWLNHRGEDCLEQNKNKKK